VSLKTRLISASNHPSPSRSENGVSAIDIAPIFLARLLIRDCTTNMATSSRLSLQVIALKVDVSAARCSRAPRKIRFCHLRSRKSFTFLKSPRHIPSKNGSNYCLLESAKGDSSLIEIVECTSRDVSSHIKYRNCEFLDWSDPERFLPTNISLIDN